MERVWSCSSSLSKACPLCYRLVSEDGQEISNTHHGPFGERGVLGYGNQAGPSARIIRLSGVYPQNFNRYQLYCLCKEIAWGKRYYLPSVCHPQCTDACHHYGISKRAGCDAV